SLSGTDASDFSIDSSTGVVTLLNNPDYETKSSYSFIVTATDGAGNHTDQAVTLDVNDIAPEASIVLSPATVQLEALGKTNGYDVDPQITAVGSAGAYVVTWSGEDSDGDWSIFVQAFNADGSFNGTTVQLELGKAESPQITAVGSDGAYVVTWYGYEGAGYSGDRSIFVQAFKADGSFNGTTVQLEGLGNTTGHDFDPQITAVGNAGAYVVTWYGRDSDVDYSIFVQAFNADGSVNGTTVQLEGLSNTTGHDYDPQITAVGSAGAYVVTWRGDDSDGDYSIFVQAFKADGSFNGDTVQLEALGKTNDNDYYPQITAVGSDGAYVVTWYGRNGDSSLAIFVQAFDADGFLNGATVQLGTLDDWYWHPQITAVGSAGAYVVTWYGDDSDGDYSIFVQAFDANGSFNGDTVQLEAPGNTTSGDYWPQITAVGTDGAYVVTWYGRDSDGDFSIFVQAFNAEGSVNGDTVQLEALGYTTDYAPQITAVGSAGAYVVTWVGTDSDGDESIFVQAFNADGTLVIDSTYETGELITLQSNEAGTVYLVSDT
ncbi:cadherin repeat domain-containing protein, partial [Oceanobacter sp. 4_MG-2023]|uniref:cadherin repeat domain-containing protein n=1 Tax=Oceanobacter sp. 4_MG-2023 TaxID=3062623 RepID=UPI00273655B5